MKKVFLLFALFVVFSLYGDIGEDSLNVKIVGGYLTGETYSLWAKNDTLYMGSGYGLHIVDRRNDVSLSYYPLYAGVLGIEKRDSLLYVYDGFGYVDVFNVKDPNNMTLISSVFVKDTFGYMGVANDVVLISDDSSDTLFVIDESNPFSPAVASKISTGGGMEKVLGKDTLAFVCAYGGGFFIYNVADPYNPVLLSSIDTINAISVSVYDTICYVGTPSYVYAYNISDIYNPVYLGSYSFSYYEEPDYLWATDTVLFALTCNYDDNGILISLDVRDPSNISRYESYYTGGTYTCGFFYDSTTYKMYICDYESPIEIVDVEYPDLMLYSSSYTNAKSLTYCLVDDTMMMVSSLRYGSPLFSISDINHVRKVDELDQWYLDRFVRSDTLMFFINNDWWNYTTWTSSILVCRYKDGQIDSLTTIDLWNYDDYDGWYIDVKDTICYFSYRYKDGAGNYNACLDLINIKDIYHPYIIRHFEKPTYTLPFDVAGNYLATVDTFGVKLYIFNDTGIDSFDIYDLSEVWAPKDIEIRDSLIYFSIRSLYSEGGLFIVNIKDPSSPQLLSNIYPGGTFYTGDMFFKCDYLYMTWEYNGIRIIDVSDPANPQEIGYYDTYGISNPASIGFVDSLFVAMVGSDGFLLFKTDSIIDKGWIGVLSPVNNKTVFMGRDIEINWRNSDDITSFDIKYSIDGGRNYNEVVSDYSGNFYTWTVPYLKTNDCVFKVSSAENSGVYDISQSVSIHGVKILSPSNSDTLNNVDSLTVSFTAGNGYLKCYFSYDGGNTWELVGDSIPGDLTDYSFSINDTTTNGVLKMEFYCDTIDTVLDYDVITGLVVYPTYIDEKIGKNRMNVIVKGLENGVYLKNVEGDEVVISIYDVSGRRIDKFVLSDERFVYLKKGIYFVKYSNKTNKIVVR